MKKQIWRVTRDGKNFVGTDRIMYGCVCCGEKQNIELPSHQCYVHIRCKKCWGQHNFLLKIGGQPC